MTVIPFLTAEPDFRHVIFAGGHEVSVGKHPFIKEYNSENLWIS